MCSVCVSVVYVCVVCTCCVCACCVSVDLYVKAGISAKDPGTSLQHFGTACTSGVYIRIKYLKHL